MRSSQDTDKNPRNLLGLGYDGIYHDAFGRQKITHDYSLFRSMFTYDVPKKLWIEYTNGIEVPFTNATSSNGLLKLVSNGSTSTLSSKRHPRHQPNRGALYSNSAFIDNATLTNGTLYAVVRTTIDTVTQELREAVHIPKWYNPAAGNIYDIQNQWRGVGGITFYIGEKRVYKYDFNSKLSNLSISNPTLPARFEVINDGTIRFGMFNDENGAFFEWVFNTTQETQLRSGCVDITSEGGGINHTQFVSAVGNEVIVTSSPILAIRISNTFNGKLNTRDSSLARVKSTTDKKSDLKVYYTRDSTALTITTGAFIPLDGPIEVYAPVLATDSTFDSAKADLIDVIPLDVNINNVEDNPAQETIDFFLIHGDYLVFIGEGANAAIRAIIQLGEEI